MENLSLLSTKVYGTASNFREILDANDLLPFASSLYPRKRVVNGLERDYELITPLIDGTTNGDNNNNVDDVEFNRIDWLF